MTSPPDGRPTQFDKMVRIAKGFAILAAIYFAVTLLLTKPANVKPEGWRLFGIFIATIAGLMIEPISGGAVVLVGVTLSILFGGLSVEKALGGFGDPTVWLVIAAFFISRGLINTGFARRIALFFVKLVGNTSLGVCYALQFSDVALAGMIPSNGARSGGVILPIVRSIAELYGSTPAKASLLGGFLFAAVYQGICVSAAMFFTGQASNPLAAGLSKQAGFEITWSSWLVAGSVPGLVSLLLNPWLILKLHPPEIRHTPEAAAFASDELRKMGPMSLHEWILAAVFAGVCGLWVTSAYHGIDITVVALLGAGALLITGVLDWEDIKAEKSAWDIFIWYGGLVMLGKALNATGVTTVFAQWVGGAFGDVHWGYIFVGALLIYFYAHYAFAGITTHILSMFPPFVAVLAAKGAPIGLVCMAFACYSNFAAGLTQYGTTPAPMYYAHGYVTARDWWRIGFIISVVNVLVWATVGFAWWKALGIW